MKRWKILIFIFIITGCGYYWILTGPTNLEQYPQASQSPYRLPWPAGVKHFCIQSNRGVVSHRDWDEFAYDFLMPVGSDVSASRDGIVIHVTDYHNGNGSGKENNIIIIQHKDGTLGHYLHVKQHGSYVDAGDRIEQGQLIAASGNVGHSLMPHLHFAVVDPQENKTLPITFADVSSDSGIPRMFKWYTSENTTYYNH